MGVLFSSYLLFPFLLHMIMSFTSSASSDQLLSSLTNSKQVKFWSENVNNKMPTYIFTKLSPLNTQDSKYYGDAISRNNFKADTRFCSLAKLVCTNEFNNNAQVNFAQYVRLSGTITGQSKINYEKGSAPSVEQVNEFLFFKLSTLRKGHTVHVPNLKRSLPVRAFLPTEIAKKIPLSQKLLTDIFPKWPKQGIVETVSDCAAAAIKGETKACPKSVEEIINFSKTALKTSKLHALTSMSAEAGSAEDLIIGKAERFKAEKIVTCHEMSLPFATYYCHSLSSSRIYTVDLVDPKTQALVNTAMAMCHMDTSSWSENHVAFKILKFRPGQGEACHWMDVTDLAWIAAAGKNM